MKNETGQAAFLAPHLIIENGTQKTFPQEMAASLNRQFLQKIRRIK